VPARYLELHAHQLRDILERSGEHLRHAGQRVEIRTRAPHRPPSAQELRAHRVAHLIQFANQDRPDLSGAPHVRAAACAAVEALYRDNTQNTGALGGLAQVACLGGILEVDADRPVFEDCLVGAPLGVEQRGRVERRDIEVDGGTFLAQVEADRGQPEPGGEDGRKQVLSTVLLHVVEAAVPLDPALDFLPFDGKMGRRHDVRDALAFVRDLHDRHARNSALIVRLSP